jgi:serine/threonine protein kinase
MSPVWSYGIVLLEMLTGEVHNVSVTDLLKGRNPTPGSRILDVSLLPFIEIYEMCTQRQPQDRPTAKSLISKLELLEL